MSEIPLIKKLSPKYRKQVPLGQYHADLLDFVDKRQQYFADQANQVIIDPSLEAQHKFISRFCAISSVFSITSLTLIHSSFQPLHEKHPRYLFLEFF